MPRKKIGKYRSRLVDRKVGGASPGVSVRETKPKPKTKPKGKTGGSALVDQAGAAPIVHERRAERVAEVMRNADVQEEDATPELVSAARVTHDPFKYAIHRDMPHEWDTDFDYMARARELFDTHFKHELPEQHRGRVGGSFLNMNWDRVGKEVGKASVLAGGIGLAASGVVGFVNPAAGAAMAAVSTGALGVGTAINKAYGT